MQYEPFSKLYNCYLCSTEERKQNGCIRPRKQVVKEIRCLCEGLNKRCQICKGKGIFEVKRCPASILNEPSINLLLPFFFFYRETKRFPDDRAILEQPVKLLEAFNLMGAVGTKRETELMKVLKDKK